MRRIYALVTLALAFAATANAQGAAIDWPFTGNDAQRTGWEKSDSRITKDNVKDFQLVMKMSLDPKAKGARSLTPPVMIGRLISYRGFKELAFVQGASDRLWAVDADMNRIFWEKNFEKADHSAKNSGPNVVTCAATVSAAPSLTPPVVFGGGRGRSGAPPPPAAPQSTVKSLLSSGGFGGPRPLFALSSDGRLHLLNTSTGEDVTPAMTFLPPGAIASSLTVSENAIYTTTTAGCGGAPNGVWALDLNGEEPKVSSFTTNAGALPGLGGVTFGADGTVYAQTSEGTLDPSSNKWANSVVALSPKELKVSRYFTAPSGLAATTPVVFTDKEHEYLVAAGKNGRLYLLDPKALGGSDHQTPLSETAPVGTIWGALSSWQDTDGNRWVLAPVWGPVDPALKSDAKNGAIVAFKLGTANGKPTLTPAWVSHDLMSPQPPVITSGIVFALSAGDYMDNENMKPTGHATLFAFDGTTGKELYSSADKVASPANLTGVTLANSRVFFTTTDGTLYGFGIFLER
jgi:hypothetical protein